MQPENLEPRVTALEREVQANKVDVAAVRELVSAADRDVSEMGGFRRATVASLNALREDIVDMRRDMGDGFRRVDDNFAQVDDGFAEMRAKFDMTAAGQHHIVELIQSVIDVQGGTAPA